MASFSKSEGSSVGILNDEQKAFFDKLIAQVMPEIGRGVKPYPGQIAPGVSSLQQLGFDQLAGSFTGETGDALSRMLSGAPAYEIDPEARQKVYDAEKALMMSQFRGEIAPMIEERYQARGAGRSGGLERSLSQAGGDLGLGLGSFYAGLGYQDEQARRAALEAGAERQLSGLGMWGGMVGNQLAGGEMQRGILGEQLAEAYNSWLSTRPYINPWLTTFLPGILGTQAKAPVTESKGWGIMSG